MSGKGTDAGLIDARLRRFVLAHLLSVVGEWAVTVGILVHAFAWGGAGAVGLTSLAILAPPLVFAPLAASLTARHRADRVRLLGLGTQALAYTAAAAVATAGAASPLVAAFVVIGLGAINTLRPTGAVLLPATVRSTAQLVTANVRVAWCDSSSALVGPLLAAAAAGFGDSSTVFWTCALMSTVAFGATAWRSVALTVRPDRSRDEAARRPLRRAIGDVRDHPWSLGVLGVASARNIVVGGLDVVLVVLAIEALDLGDRGPGLLSSLVGAGAFASVAITTAIVTRSRLRPALSIAAGVAAVCCIATGVRPEHAVVFAALPLVGLSASLIDNAGRMLLQRSTDPRRLGPLFALLGWVSGVGQLTGSIVAQVLLAVGGVEHALIGLGVVIALLAAWCTPALRRADDHSELPVVEMSLLLHLPMFSPLPPMALEAVARNGEYQAVDDGEVVIRQGEHGDRFYAVVDGDFDIVMNGRLIRTARRGSFFGEVALLTERTRTATVTARGPGRLLTVDRDPFLTAVTGHEPAHGAAMAVVDALELDPEQR